MKKLRLRAFAKVNLSLNITGKRNGLHTLDSVMMSVDIFDTLTVTERTDDNINVSFVGADVDSVHNTAYKAAALVREKIGCGVDILVEKGIPVGAGLGGSSADGAAVLRALDVFYRLPEHNIDMRSTALAVGSDVPFMLTGGLARVTGTGEELFFIENKLKVFAVGIMSGFVSTSAAYARFDEMYGGAYSPTDNDEMTKLLLSGDSKALEFADNALYKPACELLPAISENAALLERNGGRVNMTGSGGMAVGYFTDMDKFVACAHKLNSSGAKVFSSAPTGILHEWLER